MTRIDPHSHFDDAQSRTRHVHLRYRVDFAWRVLHGEAMLFLEGPGGAAPGGTLDLDTRGLSIHCVYLPGTETEVPFELGEEDPILGRRLRLHLPEGTQVVSLAFETSPEASGLQWLEPAQTAGGQHSFLFSQCQAIHARSLLPCQDSAAARITYTAEVTVPEALSAVMSADSAAVEPGSEPGTRIFHFKMPQPIPTYLLALAVGHLESRDLSPRARVWAEPATVEAAAWEFEQVEDFIQKAEALFGPYDWDRYDMIVLPPSFPYGGMENPRMTFLTPTLLAGDRSLVDVVAHELAHSWTGNLVTNATAEHFWLNEGFTVWAERRIKGAIFGSASAALGWALGQKDLDDSLARFVDRPELTRLRTHLEGIDPDDAFSSIPYEKGARFVVALEQALGASDFDAFVKAYMAEFRFQSITTEQFCAFVEAKHPGLLARVDAETWLHGEGMPEDAPRFDSPELAAIQALADGWAEGRRPEADRLRAWSPAELLVFLQRLPGTLSHEDCAWLDGELGLTGRGNMEILVQWLVLATGAGYTPVFPRVRQVLSTVGRMKFIRPLYKALGRTEAGRTLGREVFAEVAPRYHGLTRRVADGEIRGWDA